MTPAPPGDAFPIEQRTISGSQMAGLIAGPLIKSGLSFPPSSLQPGLQMPCDVDAARHHPEPPWGGSMVCVPVLLSSPLGIV